MRLILASASPRREHLLRRAGFEFLIHPSGVDEAQVAARRMPADAALRIAQLKAQDVSSHYPQDVTLAADTIVAFGDDALGKPADEPTARAMIDLLSGTTHIVITGLVVRCPARNIELSQTVMSAVRMKNLTPRSVDQYIASGLWRGKAGGYGIQDPQPIVLCVGGSRTNVIGLPMAQTRLLLQQAGVQPVEQVEEGD